MKGNSGHSIPAMIAKETVEHIARLARVHLTESEKEKFGKDLSAIIAFVEKLNELDTAAIAPLAGGTDLVNVMRPDAAAAGVGGLSGQSLLDQAPKTRNGFLETKAVFEHRS